MEEWNEIAPLSDGGSVHTSTTRQNGKLFPRMRGIFCSSDGKKYCRTGGAVVEYAPRRYGRKKRR